MKNNLRNGGNHLKIYKPLVLVVLDGWGINAELEGNAIANSKIPTFNYLRGNYPCIALQASGISVGLAWGEPGNSEVGHMTIGSGIILYQNLPRINLAIQNGSFFSNPVFLEAINRTIRKGSALHLLGLVSNGGVHSHIDHLFALIELAVSRGVKKMFVHAITDGRDTSPKAGLGFIKSLQDKLQSAGVGKIASIAGRNWTMDRNQNWDRIKKGYDAIFGTYENKAYDPLEVISSSYQRNVGDEFIEPTIILDREGRPLPRVANHDSIIFYNFRIDRPRQLTRAFVLPNFETHTELPSFDPYAVKYFHKHVVEIDSRQKPFKRQAVFPNLFFVTMTEYERNLPCTVAFPPEPVKMPLGRVFSDLGWRQLRLAETEKERFVTYYFNGMREDHFPGEDRLIVPSPKVATYDFQPEMSAQELTNKLLDRLAIGVYSFILVNFANPDMVGHTGNIPAAVRACEVVDDCVGKIVSHVLAVGGTCIITADHGNVEEMLGSDGQMDTEHSTFPVPLIIIDHMFDGYPSQLPLGKLADIGPTILALRQIPIPAEMTGTNLLADFLVSRR
ncbi:MAG: 2,3-bisphosphoglycerate-independent phosphoglycerate mutase [Patescibacteria group bacterium]